MLAEQPAQQPVQLGDDLVEVEDPRLRAPARRLKIEQLAGERRRALGGAPDLLDVRRAGESSPSSSATNSA